MGKCKDCKWWEPYTDPRGPFKFGDCAKFDYTLDYLEFPEESNLVHIAFDPQALMDFFIGADFGCIHFERREK